MRIFVSYSSRNRPQVTALVQDLEGTGHDVWYDQEAAGGHEWWADILENIRACELFIFALTPESLDSEACRREYRYAHALHKRILPVRLNATVNPASLTTELQKINFVDYFTGAEQEYRQLVRAITSLKPPVPMPEPMPDEPPVPISPLGELREKIAARSIGVETQTYLVYELKQYVEKVATRAEALELLQRLQKHSDLRVGVANEITTLITPYMPRKLPETPRKSDQPFVSRRVMAGGLVGLVAIAVVIGLVILLSSGDEGNKEKQTDAGDRTEVALDLTDTPTYTPSPTDEPTATSTQTSTATNTLSPTREVSPTHTNTATPSPTDEPTNTPTIRATDTPTSTSTASTTHTPSPTSTPTSTMTATHTPSPTSTLTPTSTAIMPLGFEKVTTNAQWQEQENWPFDETFKDGVTMVLVPAGCFGMGSTVGATSEMPVTLVCFDEPFYIDQYEVTQGDFARLGGVAARRNYFIGAGRPREWITWFEARDFCEQRGGRLPTEAEWEYAARGPDALIYPWGNEFDADKVVYWSNSNGETADVGSKESGVSWVGAYDLSGNVWEWVSSLYLPYDSVEDREDNSNSTDPRVLRGGSWLNGVSNVRSALRDWGNPHVSDYNDGFRCVRSY